MQSENACLFKVSNRNAKTMYEICLKVTVKTFEEIIDLVLMYLFSFCYFTHISMSSIFDFEQVSPVCVIEYYAFFPNFRCCCDTLRKRNKCDS